MSRPGRAGSSWDPRLTAWLTAVEAAWVRAGLSAVARTEMRTRLRDDLAQAMRDGAPVDDLVSVDPVTFAAELADAVGHQPPRLTSVGPALARLARTQARITESVAGLSERRRFVVVALAGAVAGAALGMATVFPVGTWLIDGVSLQVGYRAEGVLALVMWVLVSLVAAGSAGLAVWHFFPDSAHRRRLAGSAILGLLVGGAVVGWPTVALADAFDYPSQVVVTTGYTVGPGLVMLEVALVMAGLLAGLLAAGELTWRRTERLR